jgi:hypothetical protein
MDEWGGCIGALIVIALVIWLIGVVVTGIFLGLAYAGLTILIAIEFLAHGLMAIGIASPTAAWLVLGVLVGGITGFALGFRSAGKRSAVPWVLACGGVLLVGLFLGSELAPVPATPLINSTQTAPPVNAASATQWRGMVGRSPATLDLIPQSTRAGWIGRITYQGIVEELNVNMEEGGAIVLTGKSFRRIKGSGSFSLDTFRGQFLADGIQGSYTDSTGNRGQWKVVRVNASVEKPAVTATPGAVAATGKRGVTIEGNRDWTDTGINLLLGDTVNISATGSVKVTTAGHVPTVPSMSPAGYPPDCASANRAYGPFSQSAIHGFPAFDLPCWSLIGRVGAQGSIFEVGPEKALTATIAGELYLGVNDDNTSDNSGNWTASITVLQRSEPGTSNVDSATSGSSTAMPKAVAPRAETRPGESGTDSLSPRLDPSERLLRRGELEGLTKWELQILRNLPYARHGYSFQQREFRDYFSRQPWYRATIPAGQFLPSMLTPVEQQNVALISQFQKDRGLE